MKKCLQAVSIPTITRKIFPVLLFGLLACLGNVAFAQDAILDDVKLGLQTASVNKITTLFNEKAEVIVEGSSSGTGRKKAEQGLKEFLKSKPPVDFKYVHKGTPKGGLCYAIGKYTYKVGSKPETGYLKAYIVLHFENNKFWLESLEFSTEEK